MYHTYSNWHAASAKPVECSTRTCHHKGSRYRECRIYDHAERSACWNPGYTTHT